MFKYVGRSVEVKYENGYHFKMDYLSEDTLRWTSLVKRENMPMTGTQRYYLNEQGNEIVTISWVEADGFSVSQNVDYANGTVYSFMTWNDENAYGGRAVMADRGTVKLLD